MPPTRDAIDRGIDSNHTVLLTGFVGLKQCPIPRSYKVELLFTANSEARKTPLCSACRQPICSPPLTCAKSTQDRCVPSSLRIEIREISKSLVLHRKSRLASLSGPYHFRLRPVSRLVLREPLSPIALRHCMFNWPSVTLSSVPSSCDGSDEIFSLSRKATCRVSLGCRIGALAGSELVLKASQLSERHVKADVGLTLTACLECEHIRLGKRD
jgi:hypothetical protein